MIRSHWRDSRLLRRRRSRDVGHPVRRAAVDGGGQAGHAVRAVVLSKRLPEADPHGQDETAEHANEGTLYNKGF